MTRRLLMPVLVFLASMPAVFGQITNTTNTIYLSSGVDKPKRVCSWNDIPATSAGNHEYEMYVLYEDWDANGTETRWPATGYYPCVVTKSAATPIPDPPGTAPNLIITVNQNVFPTVATSALGFDFSFTKGTVFLRNTITNAAHSQVWETEQYRCLPLPIYISSFTFTNLSDRLKFDWTAVDESNYLSHYVLQKSNNGFTWVDDVLEPAITGLGNHNYTVYANKPGYPWMWYRLKWYGEYGYFTTSNKIQVFNTGSTATNIVCNYTNIKGPDSACASQSKVYKLHNAPAGGATYSWSASGGTVTSTDQGGLKATISFPNVASATVSANSANNSCNKSKAVAVGGTGYVTVNSNMISTNSSYTHYVLSVNTLWPGTIGSQYNWYLSGGYVGSGQSWSFDVPPGLCVNVTVSVNTACGLVSGASNLCYVEPPPCNPNCEPCIPCDDPPIDPRIAVMPVPARDILTVAIRPGDVKNSTPGKWFVISPQVYTVQLYDMIGNLRLERKNVSFKSPLQLDIRNLPVGNYILHIKNAKHKITRQVRIQR